MGNGTFYAIADGDCDQLKNETLSKTSSRVRAAVDRLDKPFVESMLKGINQSSSTCISQSIYLLGLKTCRHVDYLSHAFPSAVMSNNGKCGCFH